MKILHTSDWHLGHRLHEHSQHEEQASFLQWLKLEIETQLIDVLLISGDIFDTGVPSTQSQKLYYDFLVSLHKTHCKYVIVTGGNHDAPGTINAPKELLGALNIFVVGKASEDINDEIFSLKINNEELIVAAVPYLRDQDIRRAVAGESFDAISERYKKALTLHYQAAAEQCESKINTNSFCLAMGHLFAIGGSTSESEQTIYVGNLGDIGANDFPSIFQYVALGHLHKAQKVGGANHIRYSGSPYVLSFSEVGSPKKVILLEINGSNIDEIKEIETPEFRSIKNIRGSFENCVATINEIAKQDHPLTPWIAVELDEQNGLLGYSDIQKASEHLNLEVLKVTHKNQPKQRGIEELIASTKHVKELEPYEVFVLKCEEKGVQLSEHPELKDAFSEALNAVQKS